MASRSCSAELISDGGENVSESWGARACGSAPSRSAAVGVHQRVDDLVEVGQVVVGAHELRQARPFGRIPRPRAERLPVQDLLPAVQRRSAGGVVQQGAQRERVCGRSYGALAAPLLGRGVLGRADERPRPRQPGHRPGLAEHAGDAEVAQAHHRRVAVGDFQQHVAGLEVAVDDAAGVHVVERQAQLPAQLPRALR
jgi:hypothetical protein